jgi:hypothetical protein
MHGLKFDFEKGDLVINASGAFEIGSTDNQNVALIATSQVCRLTRPEFGAQIGSRMVNQNYASINSILADAKRQAETDGAKNVSVRFTEEQQLIFVGTYEN